MTALRSINLLTNPHINANLQNKIHPSLQPRTRHISLSRLPHRRNLSHAHDGSPRLQLLPTHLHRQRRKTNAQNGRSHSARQLALERQTMDRCSPRRRRIWMALLCSSTWSNFPSHHLTRAVSLLFPPNSRQSSIVGTRSLDRLSLFVPPRHRPVVSR